MIRKSLNIYFKNVELICVFLILKEKEAVFSVDAIFKSFFHPIFGGWPA